MQVAAMAVTNFDLVEMTRAGVGEDVIISTIRSRGGRFDLSPNGLIALKQSGVSDRVVMAAQSSSPGAFAPAARRRSLARRRWSMCNRLQSSVFNRAELGVSPSLLSSSAPSPPSSRALVGSDGPVSSHGACKTGTC